MRTILVMCGLLAGTVCAEQASEGNFSIWAGAGAAWRNSLYAGDDARVLPVPAFVYRQGRFYVLGRRAGYRLYQDADERIWLDAVGQWRFDGYKSSDSAALEGMRTRRMTLDAGLWGGLDDGWGRTSIGWVTDVLGHHDGHEVSLGYGKRLTLEKLTLTPSAGVLWKSARLGDYYYGVRADEARAGRPAHGVGDTWNPFAGLELSYLFSERWMGMVSFRYTWLDSAIRRSPIVEDSYETLVMAGLMVRF